MTLSIVVLNILFITTAGQQLSITTDLEFHGDGVSTIMHDADDYCELLITREFRHYLTDTKIVTHFQLNIPEDDCHFLCCVDLDGQPPQELIFQSKKNDTIWVYVYSGSNQSYRFQSIHGRDTRKPAGWDGWLTSAHALDANNDGHSDLVFSVATNFDLQPRGIMAYDLRNDKEIWSCWIGAFPRNPHFADLDGDGNPEIFVSTTATSNGSDFNGFSDRKSYVFCMDRTGRMLWSRQVGGVFSDLLSWVGDMDDDGGLEVVAVDCEGPAGVDDPNGIMILDAATGDTKKFIRSGRQYLGTVVCDINRDEKEEIIVGNTDGTVRVYSSTLDLLASRDFAGPVKVLDAADFNGDGAYEVVCLQADNTILFSDEYLNTLADYRSDHTGNPYLCRVQEGRKTKFIVHSGIKPNTYALMSLSAPPLVNRIVKQASPFLLVPMALLCLIAVYLIVQNKRLANRVTQREQYTGQILEWSGLAQRLAHEIKNPLSTINLTLQRVQEICDSKLGEEARPLNKYTTSILEEIERVRATVDKFMKILAAEKANYQPNDINRIIETVMHKYESMLPGAIRIKKNLAKDLPLVKCDENQLATVFSNVIENALEAMEGRGTLTLRTSFTEKVMQNKIVAYVETRIEDTGTGMSKEQQKELFKPFRSTKAGGTGLGLVIAKKIVDGHTGTINLTSKKSVGTVVTINIPAGRDLGDRKRS